jgi:predicted phage terminase large subunit-like protein
VLDAFYGGAASGGKSSALLQAALMYVHVPGYNALLLRDTYKNLATPGSLMDRAHEWLNPTDAKWKDDKKRFTFPSGATLTFGYLDGPRDHFQYLSSEFQFIGIDECVNIREHQALYLFSRLRKNEGIDIPLRFRCASNPPAREQVARGEWVKNRYVDPHTKSKDAVFIPAWMDDNPFVNKEEYRKSLANLDPITRAQLEKGDWEISAKGEMFERGWFEIVDEAPKDAEYIRYWDLASTEVSKEGVDPDYTVGLQMCKSKEGIYYITSVIRFRKTPRYVEQIVRQTADMDGKGIKIWMEEEPGSSGVGIIDTYRRKILPEFIFKGDKVTGSKINRAMPLASQAEAGNVKLVKGLWNKDFLDEIELFPDGGHDDQVDAASGAFDKLAGYGVEAKIRII